MAGFVDSLMGGDLSGALGVKNNYNQAAPGVASQIDTFNPHSFGATGSANPLAASFQNPFNAGAAQGVQGQVQGNVGQQQAFLNALAQQGGVGNQANVFAQQQALAGQLGQQAMGAGPNPALAQLSQATGNNIQNQAALMAGQRGAGHNVGALGKSIAEQGAATQQQAAGQAATMQAQQQLAAQQALQGQQASMANLATQQVGQQAQGLSAVGNLNLANQQQVLGSLAAQNQASLGMQENLNNIRAQAQQNASMINAQSAMQQNQIGAQMVQQANQIRQQNAAQTAQNQLGAGQINAGVAQGNQATNSNLIGGLMQSGGSALPMLMGARGGMVPKTQKMSEGGELVAKPNYWLPGIQEKDLSQGKNQPASSFGKKVNGYKASPAEEGDVEEGAAIQRASGTSFGPQMGLNEGEYEEGAPLGLQHAQQPNNFGAGAGEGMGPTFTASQGGQIKNVGHKLKSGGGVPGKAKVKGDSLKNDTVNAKLSPGEIVIPRSVVNSKDPVKGAASFVAAILARRK